MKILTIYMALFLLSSPCFSYNYDQENSIERMEERNRLRRLEEEERRRRDWESVDRFKRDMERYQ